VTTSEFLLVALIASPFLIVAALCVVTLAAEPRAEDPPPTPARDLVDFDEERL